MGYSLLDGRDPNSDASRRKGLHQHAS